MATGRFGEALPRTEDDRLLRGEGRFLDDLDDSGSLHAVFLRSPIAHGRIVSIDASQAIELPGVRGVFTAADLDELSRPLLASDPDTASTPASPLPLAADEVRYVGEPIAVIVAEDRYLAEDALDLVDLELEALPVVADLERAAAPGSPLVHTELPANRGAVSTQTVGSPREAFVAADVVVRRRVAIERSAGMPLETRGVMARYDPALDSLVVFDSTQAPTAVRTQLSELLGVPAERVRVVAPDTGGGFGTKVMLLYPEEVVIPFLARRLRCPVKWVEDRAEHFVASTHERKQIHEIELAATRDGTVVGLRDVFLARLRRVPAVRLGRGRGRRFADSRSLSHPEHRGDLRGDLHEHRPGDPVPRLRPAAGLRSPRSHDGRPRRDARHRQDGAPQAQSRVSGADFPYAREGLSFVDGETVVLDSGDYDACLRQVLDALDYDGFRASRNRRSARAATSASGSLCTWRPPGSARTRAHG